MVKITKDWVEAYFEYGIDVQNRKVFLTHDIDAESIGAAIKGLYLMEAENTTKPIEVFVGSFGGSEYEMFALYDVLRTLESPIHTTAIGKCMSAAPLLVAAGQPGYRWATPNTFFMVHQSWDEFGPSRTDEMRKVLKHYEVMSKRWYDLMESHTKKDAVFWKRKCESVGDCFFTAEEAMEWGLIDNIWDQKGGEPEDSK
jgi:ATP-dependent Clp protease protease subunit